jgi:DNA-binding protein HU-beta
MTIIAPVEKPKAPKPITTKQMAYALAVQHQLTKKLSQKMLEDLASLITKYLKKGNRVRMAGLGIFKVWQRAARMGRNPGTGEAIKIKASKNVAFRAAKDLKTAI